MTVTDTPKFIEITPKDGECHRLVSTDMIATILKSGDLPGNYTIVRLKDGSQLEVDESLKTLQARMGLL